MKITRFRITYSPESGFPDHRRFRIDIETDQDLPMGNEIVLPEDDFRSAFDYLFEDAKRKFEDYVIKRG